MSQRMNSVAVFDVLNSPSRQHPLVLMQPTPRLQDFIPQFDMGSVGHDLEATFIGLVETNGSLFAMSPEHFPLVVFHQQRNHAFTHSPPAFHRPTIDAPPGEGRLEDDTYLDLPDLPDDIDGVSRLLKEHERCKGSNGHWDRSCLTGKRPVESSGSSRVSRLLPDRAAAEEQHRRDHDWQVREGSGVGSQDGNISHGTVSDAIPLVDGPSSERKLLEGGGRPALTGAVAAFAIFIVGLWYLTRKVKGSKGHNTVLLPPTLSRGVHIHTLAETSDGRDLAHVSDAPPKSSGVAVKSVDFALIDSADEKHDDVLQPALSPSLPEAVTSAPATPTPATMVGNGRARSGAVEKQGVSDSPEDVEGEDDSDHEADNLGAQGKKKGTRRRKRGKKNKGANANVISDEGAGGSTDEKKIEEAVALPTSGLILSPSNSATNSSAQPMLQVSDEILGELKL